MRDMEIGAVMVSVNDNPIKKAFSVNSITIVRSVPIIIVNGIISNAVSSSICSFSNLAKDRSFTANSLVN